MGRSQRLAGGVVTGGQFFLVFPAVKSVWCGGAARHACDREKRLAGFSPTCDPAADGEELRQNRRKSKSAKQRPHADTQTRS